MPHSAGPHDEHFLLHGLDHTIFRLRLHPTHSVPVQLPAEDAAILAFVRDHPGTTVTALWGAVPELQTLPYNEVRAHVVVLLDQHILERAGTAPLEEVDGRYERVPACAVCGADSAGHRAVFWKFNTPVVRCTGCGLLYANPRWQAEHLFGRYTEEYWAHYIETVKHTAFDPAANQARWDAFLIALEQVAGTPGRVLDVGCATGEFLAASKACGWDAYGVETSAIGAAYATQAHGVQVHVGPLDTAPWPDGWFDAITLWDVIEHVQSPRTYLEHIARLLRPGGVFGLTTPNIRSLPYLLLGRGWEAVGPNDHIYYFAPRTLVRLLHDTGFAVHMMGTMDMRLVNWELWLRSPRLRALAPRLAALTRRPAARFLLGEELVVIARKTS